MPTYMKLLSAKNSIKTSVSRNFYFAGLAYLSYIFRQIFVVVTIQIIELQP